MQKDLEQRMLSLLLNDEKAYPLALELGLSKDCFVVFTEPYDFVQTYYFKYKALPSPKILKASFAEVDVLSDVPSSEHKFLVDELIKSMIRRRAINFLNQGSELILKDTYGGIDFIISRLSGIRRNVGYSKSFTDKDSEKRLDEAKDRKSQLGKGLTYGIKTGIATLDKGMIGWLPGNLVTIVGRLGVGKSYFSLYVGATAWVDGKRILYISPEMTTKEVELRWDIVTSSMYNYEFSHERLQRGDIDLKKYAQWIAQAKMRGDWLTIDSNNGRSFTVQSIQGYVDEFSPDIVIVDGIALLIGEGKEHWEKVKNIASDLKVVAQNNKLVVIATAQATRSAKDDMPELHEISYSDAVAQESDIVIMMNQDKTIPNVRFLTIPKRRGGRVYNKKIRIEFDVDKGRIGMPVKGSTGGLAEE